MWTQSDLEFDLLLLCEVDPDIVYFIEQPCLIRYRTDSAIRSHRPDLLARHKSGAIRIIEVKYEQDAAEDEQRWLAIGPAVAQLGFTYCVLTERHIRRQPRRRNVQTLCRDRLAEVPRNTIVAVAEVLSQSGILPIEEIINRVPALRLKHVHRLIWGGFLAADLDIPLTTKTRVHLVDHIDHSN
jgi:hypothetical protein